MIDTTYQQEQADSKCHHRTADMKPLGDLATSTAEDTTGDTCAEVSIDPDGCDKRPVCEGPVLGVGWIIRSIPGD
ncbi:unnamed protein product [Aspergillus oryzae]|nr:unnamed protein product [Aspergillus oryzae]GMF94508.1 unnamed protein product [Aspergillus oryzae]GMG03676.1 unnamed protein product [Aspergillus oryzae]